MSGNHGGLLAAMLTSGDRRLPARSSQCDAGLQMEAR